MGQSFWEIVAAVEASSSPEEVEKRLKALVKAKRSGALRILIGPFKGKDKGLPVGLWRTLKRAERRKWVANQLHKDALVKVAQRAGLLPLKVVTVPASGSLPKQRFALYGKWENPVYGTGTVKVGIFAWQDTDVFKKKKNEYKIPWSKGERDFFKKSMEIAGFPSSQRFITHIGKGDHRRQILASVRKSDHLLIMTYPPTRTDWADVAQWAVFPVVKMNDEILKATAPLIDVFGEILGALLGVVGAAVGIAPFSDATQAPEQQYKQPNYLLWGGVAVGVVVIAAAIKKRRSA